ncbi:hypothetical protein [uncultured Thiodictyon sp.]|uniref:hypothetical protein n=1 Tax=uncultured Thiodictyon sp. TaxID=1846217 RepID=UPI0025DA1AA5|nr:hypothetical protein [uncultured Thiodictyon sp.]
MRVALIDAAGLCQSVEADRPADWVPPEGYAAPPLRAIPAPPMAVGPGWCWVDDTWYAAIADPAIPGGWRVGTAEERAVESLRMARAASAIDAWQGRYILSAKEPVTDGPLAAYPAANVLAQIDLFVAVNLTASDQERYRGAKTWRRNDLMVATLGALLGMDDAAIDAWFEAARAVS